MPTSIPPVAPPRPITAEHRAIYEEIGATTAESGANIQ